MKTILITGVSTGIGKSCAKILSSNNYKVFGTIRTEEDAKILKKELGEFFFPIIMDVTNEDSIYKAKGIIEQQIPNKKLDVLINNAGIALGGPIKYIDTDMFRKQFEVNLFGVVSVTKKFLDLLGATEENQHQGKIIMISSISGKRSYPFVSPYVASKHALEGLSDCIRKELMLYGIDVILIEPGPIKTAIWDKAPDPDNNPFSKTEYNPILKKFYDAVIEQGKLGLDAEAVSKKIKKIIEMKKPKTRYVITGKKLINYTLPSILPDRLFDKLTAKMLGITKPKK